MEQNILKILAVGGVVVDSENNILLRKNTSDFNSEVWEIFATYVRPGERLEDSLKRRLSEEAGIQNIEKIEFIGKYYDDPNRHPGKTCIPFIFKVLVEREEIEPSPDCVWYSTSDIESLSLALDNKKIIKGVLSI